MRLRSQCGDGPHSMRYSRHVKEGDEFAIRLFSFSKDCVGMISDSALSCQELFGYNIVNINCDCHSEGNFSVFPKRICL